MKKYFAFFVCLLLLMGLCACAEDAHVGTYYGVYVEAEGEVYRMEDYFNGKNYLRLENGGEAKLHLNEKTSELEWKNEDGVLTFTQAGDDFYGQISDGVIQMDYMGWGLRLTFALEGAKVPETTVLDAQARQERVAEMLEFWNGDWYGYFQITEANGAYISRIGERTDAAANIALGDDARGNIVIWDAKHPRSAPLGECVLRVDDTGGEMGIAMSGQGSFFGAPVLAGDWLLDPSMSAYEDTAEISGYYADESGDFFYTIYLHPWGQTWQEIELPPSYEWYLQAVQNGEALPDELPK